MNRSGLTQSAHLYRAQTEKMLPTLTSDKKSPTQPIQSSSSSGDFKKIVPGGWKKADSNLSQSGGSSSSLLQTSTTSSGGSNQRTSSRISFTKRTDSKQEDKK